MTTEHDLPAAVRSARFPTSHRAFWTPKGFVLGWGTTVGGSYTADWAPGAIYVDTDAAQGAQVYLNTGSKTTATWTEIADAGVAGGFGMTGTQAITGAGEITFADDCEIKLGTGDDILIDFNGTNFVLQGASERVGLVTIPNLEVNIGAFSSLTQGSGVPLSSSGTGVLKVYADDNGASIATSCRNILARTLLTVDQTGGSIRSVMGQLKFADGVDVTSGIYTGVQGYVELAGDSSAKTGSTFSCFDASVEIASTKTLTIDSGGEFAGVHIETTGSGSITNNGTCSAILVSNASGAPDWPYALYVVGTDVSNGISLGTSGAPITLASASNAGFSMYTTCASQHASNNVEPFYFQSTMTGAAGVGGRARFHMTANVALGGWANALKASTTWGASGRITGLGSCLCTDMTLSAGTTQGTYCCLEANLVADSAVSTGTSTSFIYCNIAGSNGTGITTINTNGYFFEIGDGIAETNNGMFDAESITDADFTHVLRVKIDGTDYYLGLHTSKAFN
jgi:hypothetical protein